MRRCAGSAVFLALLATVTVCGPEEEATPASESAPESAPAEEPQVEVEQLADDVYLYSYNVHRSLFVVRDDAVMVTDPQSSEAAERFVEEIQKLTDAPVRWMVYSHHHADHVSGGAAFGDDVEVIAHDKVKEHLTDEIVPPDVTFDQTYTLDVDGLAVELIYPGPSETESNIVVFIPETKVAFMVDAVSVRSLPWRNMASGNPHTWKAALERLAELDFDILAPGHGPTGEKAHVRETIEYFGDLTGAVQERIDQGETLEQIQASLELPRYAGWARYDEHFDLNIEGVYRELTKQ